MMRSIGYWFCKFKEPCQFKEIKKPKNPRSKGIYYIVCVNSEGCNQKTIYPQRIRIPVPSDIPIQIKKLKGR